MLEPSGQDGATVQRFLGAAFLPHVLHEAVVGGGCFMSGGI